MGESAAVRVSTALVPTCIMALGGSSKYEKSVQQRQGMGMIAKEED